MQVFQLHLEVNQRLQEVASFKRNKYFPEEIDAALNKAQFRLLEKGVEKKFQDDQINLGTVSALIQKSKPLELIIPSTVDPLYEPNTLLSYSVLPPDMYWSVNVRAEVLKDPLNCTQAPNLATTSIVEYVAKVPFLTSTTPPHYANLTLISSVKGVLYQAPTPINAGVIDEPGKFVLIDNLVEHFYRNNTIKVYWERYRDVYTKNTFILVSKDPIGTITLSATGLTSNIVVSSSTSYTIYNRNAINPNAQSLTSVSTRTEQQDLLYQSLTQNQFYNTSDFEPIVSQTLDYLIAYREKSFLLTRLYIDYIRKPRIISLSLNQTCELSDVTHPKLVDLAVEILRLDTKDENYAATVQDTELRN
jgi:hypothetical protein